LRQRIKKKAVKENIVGNNEIEVQRLKLVQINPSRQEDPDSEVADNCISSKDFFLISYQIPAE